MRSKIAGELKSLTDNFRAKHKDAMSEMSQDAEKLLDSSRQLSRSWSGSYAGWHGRMYFRDFQIPSIYERFSGEWGGINGLPAGWEEKQPEEVQAKIESLIEAKFSTDKFESNADLFHKELKKLKDDVVVAIDQLPPEELTSRESDLINQIENFELGRTKGAIISDSLPKTMMSRDTEALRQGTCVASWLYYEGVALSAKSTCNAADELLEKSERLAKMLDKGSPAPSTASTPGLQPDLHPEIYKKCRELYEHKAYAEAVEKGFKVARDRLRSLTGYETGSEAFGKTKLHIRGAAAANVDDDFNNGVKFLTMAIDRFRNEKSHTSDAKIDDPIRAYEYLRLSSLAMHLLDNAEMRP